MMNTHKVRLDKSAYPGLEPWECTALVRACGEPRVYLATSLFKGIGVDKFKLANFQRWLDRPIDEDLLPYLHTYTSRAELEADARTSGDSTRLDLLYRMTNEALRIFQASREVPSAVS